MTSNRSDDDLMLALQGGDQSAFNEIVQRYAGPLYGFFVKNVRDTHLADDLTQETFLRVHRQFWNYIPSGRFKGWLFRIAHNLMIDDVRRKKHDALVQAVKGKFEDETDILSTIAGEFLSAEQHGDFAELQQVVDRLIEEVPEEQRLTFTLHHFAGLSLPVIAEVLETSVPTTKSRLRLAREKLSDRLRQSGFEDPNQRRD